MESVCKRAVKKETFCLCFMYTAFQKKKKKKKSLFAKNIGLYQRII